MDAYIVILNIIERLIKKEKGREYPNQNTVLEKQEGVA